MSKNTDTPMVSVRNEDDTTVSFIALHDLSDEEPEQSDMGTNIYFSPFLLQETRTSLIST